ncbi:MAG: hypothetical protein ACYTFX_05925 [Planctomycetota bacterium]
MQKEDFEQELDDLRRELENFQEEKDRVRSIIGQIGGVPKFHNRLFNWTLILATAICLVISLVIDHLSVRLLMIELASAAVSAKIIYLMHCQMRVNHFKVWVLSSIEWRINELSRLIKNR